VGANTIAVKYINKLSLTDRILNEVFARAVEAKLQDKFNCAAIYTVVF
jgi:hypothetical protein